MLSLASSETCLAFRPCALPEEAWLWPALVTGTGGGRPGRASRGHAARGAQTARAGPRPHGSVTGPRPFGLQFGPRKTFGFREVFLTRASGGWCVLRPDQGYGQSGMSQSREQGRWRRGRDGPASGLRPQPASQAAPEGPGPVPPHPVIQSEGGSCKESGRWWQEGPRAGASFITCQCGLGTWLDVSELLGLAP